MGRYIMTAERDLLRIFQTPQRGEEEVVVEGKAEAAPVAFCRAPGEISAIDCAGDRIGVGCYSGDVLHLRARFLVEL